MEKVILLISITVILVGCGPSRIHDDYRLKGLTKGQRVKNNLIHAERGKELKKIFTKIMDPGW
ncbi:MAG: hypothetical protein K9L86_01325 [Candidatus Omnitrophica bacterium]|nr:hypothetical protein [Candidatus Omnitrophota bacterium]